MSDTLNTAVEAISEKLSGADMPGSVKFDIAGEGAVRVDAGGGVSIDDGDADVTISADLDVFKDLMGGELDPTSAYMSGKLKIDGDMGMAMKLAQLLA